MKPLIKDPIKRHLVQTAQRPNRDRLMISDEAIDTIAPRREGAIDGDPRIDALLKSLGF